MAHHAAADIPRTVNTGTGAAVFVAPILDAGGNPPSGGIVSLEFCGVNPEVKDIFNFKFEDFELTNYEPHPHIKAEVAI